ncbi:voltage-gated hydrogen channel 1-like isoform X2 [Mya arenaria]|uniref:voltage-gated hydrogen channel 1-like isoform X2 n=1 Tax=Mya arenaria TaxID=6604 RepID=UPI0022E38B23|nr:voltage-gated hydrogen channel 1-like isoform X2 [Mya arenaria]
MKIQMEGFHKLQDDLEKVIEKDDSASSITTDSEETKPEFRTLRDRLKHLFSTNKFHVIVVCFVILDCLLVVAELLLDLKVFPSEANDSIAPHVLHYCSISILGLFLIEILLRVIVFRLEFFKHKLEVFDAAIVIVSFALDILYRNNEGPESGVGLLIVLRLWRVTRIINGVILSVKVQADKRLKRERRLRDACEQELMKYREYCAAQENEIDILRGLLRKHGITDFVPTEIPRPARRIDVIAEVNPVSEKILAEKERMEKTDSHDFVIIS